MKFYSTQNKHVSYTLREVVLKGLPADKGLFMPAFFPAFPDQFLAEALSLSFSDIAFTTADTILQNSIDKKVLRKITDETVSFDAPLVNITDRVYALELFHGPTLAFKDFGARFMAGLMSYYVRDENKKLTILVATSGDTGGAVASGFYDKEGIDVIILYPDGKVSPLQEKQLTTPGKNISAICVKGTFDDCQRMVKSAFSDQDLSKRIWMSSANSINISRLIPQSFYYVYAWSRIARLGLPVVFSVPSGNFGNLTAGLFAQKMGLPVKHFIAATNINDVVPGYLQSGLYQPRPSSHTLSNAMDVGDPSNFSRMLDLFNGDVNQMRNEITGFRVNDEETKRTIRSALNTYGYLLDPHGAVACHALNEYLLSNRQANGIFLETAHPAKFAGSVEEITGKKIILPTSLARLEKEAGTSVQMSNRFEDLKEHPPGLNS